MGSPILVQWLQLHEPQWCDLERSQELMFGEALMPRVQEVSENDEAQPSSSHELSAHEFGDCAAIIAEGVVHMRP